MSNPDLPSGPLAAALPSVLIVIVTILSLWIINRLVAQRLAAFPWSRIARQIATIALAGIGLVLSILALPIGAETHGQLLGLLGLLGLLVTAVVALSSGTLASNGMAGVMLRTMRSFHAGDFIRCAEHFGRVTEISLFHTEIQTTNRNLTTLPNALLIANPVTVVRHSEHSSAPA